MIEKKWNPEVDVFLCKLEFLTGKNLFLGMQITLMAIGKTDKAELESLITIYEKRLKHYIKFQMEMIPDIKNRKNLSEAREHNGSRF